MSKKIDLNQIAKIEKAIKEKYGDEAIQNPKGSWNEEKEIKYLKDLKNFYKTSSRRKTTETIDGLVVKQSKVASKINRVCPVCESYSFSTIDDVYMTKFSCCFECYVQYIEGREERWKTGWRPNN